MAAARLLARRARAPRPAFSGYGISQVTILQRITSLPFPRTFATDSSPATQSPPPKDKRPNQDSNPKDSAPSNTSSSKSFTSGGSSEDQTLPPGWEDDPDFNITRFSELPHARFGFNQHMLVNDEFKEALRQVLWQFRAPIRYAFAYGSGVFTQSSGPSDSPSAPVHPHPPEAVTKWQANGQKNIDFIFGVSFTQHWHSLNLQQHRDHYSALGSLGSAVVSRIQDNYGAGAWFHPYITINGIMIKYGVVNLDTLYRDLSEWDTMYLAGRLQKPVKILRDDARIRLANQINLISALRTALLLLPPDFTEHELYTKIASISYMGDPRIALRAEHPRKIANIVDNQMTNFRKLYLPLIENIPNVVFTDSITSTNDWTDDASINRKAQQDMDPVRRGNMVRRLPKRFRQRLYDSYQRSFQLSLEEYQKHLDQSKDETTFSKSLGTDFDQRIAQAPDINDRIVKVVKETINRPSLVQAVKGVVTAGWAKSWKYLQEKRAKGRARKATVATEAKKEDGKATTSEEKQEMKQ